MSEKIVKRSIVVANHKTSVSLEGAFWRAFKVAAKAGGKTLSQLAGEIDCDRPTANLSSAVRLYLLNWRGARMTTLETDLACARRRLADRDAEIATLKLMVRHTLAPTAPSDRLAALRDLARHVAASSARASVLLAADRPAGLPPGRPAGMPFAPRKIDPWTV